MEKLRGRCRVIRTECHAWREQEGGSTRTVSLILLGRGKHFFVFLFLNTVRVLPLTQRRRVHKHTSMHKTPSPASTSVENQPFPPSPCCQPTWAIQEEGKKKAKRHELSLGTQQRQRRLPGFQTYSLFIVKKILRQMSQHHPVPAFGCRIPQRWL